MDWFLRRRNETAFLSPELNRSTRGCKVQSLINADLPPSAAGDVSGGPPGQNPKLVPV
jgi:hypothetical protein